MVRKNLNKKSAHGIINVFPSGGIEYGYREKNGQVMKAKSGPTLDSSNQNIKVEKIKEYVYFYVNDKNEWVKIGELNIKNWGKSIYIGLATLSHDNTQLTTVTYNNIHLSN